MKGEDYIYNNEKSLQYKFWRNSKLIYKQKLDDRRYNRYFKCRPRGGTGL